MLKFFREPINGLTHLGGALFSVVGLFVLLTKASTHGNTWHLISFSVYGASLFLLYISSSLYHSLYLSEQRLSFFRKLDHMMIFILIAGTYTPFCLVSLRESCGWTLLAVIWGFALVGFILKLFWMTTPRWLTTGIYLLMGWICIFAIYPLVQTVPLQGLAWLAIGGFFYSTGALIYATRWPNPLPHFVGFHGIWHVMVLLGSLSHFLAIWSLCG